MKVQIYNLLKDVLLLGIMNLIYMLDVLSYLLKRMLQTRNRRNLMRIQNT